MSIKKFKFTNFNKGSLFYKGYSGAYNDKLLKNEKYFYLSLNSKIADIYMYKEFPNMYRSTDPYVCTYEITKPIHLLNLTTETINTILEMFPSDSVNYKSIKFAFGNASMNNKDKLLKNISENYNNLKKYVTNRSRLSLRNTNIRACKGLCEFFKQYNIDGYYFKQKPGEFHDEIMICDASNKVLKTVCKRKYRSNPNRVTVHKKNENVYFRSNVLKKYPNAKLENLEKLHKKNTLEPKITQIYLKLIYNKKSIENLNNLSKNIFKVYNTKNKNPVLYNAINYRRKMFRLLKNGPFGILRNRRKRQNEEVPKTSKKIRFGIN